MARIEKVVGDTMDVSLDSISDFSEGSSTKSIDSQFNSHKAGKSHLASFKSSQLLVPKLNSKPSVKNCLEEAYEIFSCKQENRNKAKRVATSSKVHPGSRLFNDNKKLDHRKYKKLHKSRDESPKFTPSIIKNSHTSNDRSNMKLENWLMGPKLLSHKSSNIREEFTYKPKINENYIRSKLTSQVNSENISKNKNDSTQVDSKTKTKRINIAEFLNRVKVSSIKHDKEIELLRKSIYTNLDEDTGQPLFTPKINRNSLCSNTQVWDRLYSPKLKIKK